jgi:hypothetical protein
MVDLSAIVRKLGLLVSLFLLALFSLYAFHFSISGTLNNLRPDDAEWCRENSSCLSAVCCIELFGL